MSESVPSSHGQKPENFGVRGEGMRSPGRMIRIRKGGGDGGGERKCHRGSTQNRLGEEWGLNLANNSQTRDLFM